jgi:lipid-A-disaccharide synthase
MDKEINIPSSIPKHRPTIALLPGSRTQEIRKMLPVMLKSIADFDGFDVYIAQAPAQERSIYEPYIKDYSNIYLLQGKTYDILKIADVAIVTSGTATLETALLHTKQVVVYKTNPITYAIAKKLVKVKYISLVNLILDKMSLTELIQKDCNSVEIKNVLEKLLKDNLTKTQMEQDYRALKNILSEGNHASENAANIVYNLARD